jgi:putative membrane protein
VVVSVASLAKLLGYLFAHHPILIWAFFFGLILASVYYVGKTVSHWGAGPILALFCGLAVAVAIAMVKPAAENTHTFYLVLCGIVGICSMIIPGLSGSFVLILMGNYFLILNALSELVSAGLSLDFGAMVGPIKIFIPVMVGVVLGLVGFSHFISWLFRRFRDVAVSLLTGFVAGSLMIIWPWKDHVYQLAEDGSPILKSDGEKVVQGYDWYLPSLAQGLTWMALGLIVIGVMLVILMERHADKAEHDRS